MAARAAVPLPADLPRAVEQLAELQQASAVSGKIQSAPAPAVRLINNSNSMLKI
jgi:hypothetical protein